ATAAGCTERRSTATSRGSPARRGSGRRPGQPRSREAAGAGRLDEAPSMRTAPTVRVLIASALEPPLVERIRAVDPRLDVVYRADLVGQPRYPADHTAPVTRTPAQAAEWAALVAEAEVMFDVDRASLGDLDHQAPRLRWVQLSSSGVGHLVERMGLGDRPIVVTNAAG